MTRDELVSHLRWRYPVFRKRRRLFLAAMPKAGGTFVSHFLAHLIGGETGFAGQLPTRNEQDIAPFWLWSNQHKNVAVHMHTRYHPQTQVYLDHFDLEPIVCVRNLADVIPSVVDHWRKRAVADGANWPFAHLHPHLMEQSDEHLHEFAAVHVIPWYVNFYVSWVRAGNAPIIAYDEAFSDGNPALIELAARLGFGEIDARAAIQSASGEDTRMNVGKSGRGARLARAIQERIDHAVSFYPDIDWSPVWPGYSGDSMAATSAPIAVNRPMTSALSAST